MRLENVKVGDKLVCSMSYSGHEILTVTRLTKTLAVCGTRSFALDNGKMRGTSSWNDRFARVATADDINQIEQQMRIRVAKNDLERVVVTADNIELAEALIVAHKLAVAKARAAKAES